jgi:hypothetical protein
MAVSVKDCRVNVRKAIEKDLLGYIADILNESTWEQERYIHSLRIVEHISMHSDEAANKFIDKFVHNNLMKNIRVTIIIS